MVEDGCVFCGIVEGKVPGGIIHKTERTTSFTALDGGYPLIVTNRHFRDWTDPELDEETMKELVMAQTHLVRAVMATGAAGVSIISNNSRAAGQEIDHLHVHIMSRTPGDSLVRFNRGERLTREQLDGKASLYRTTLVKLGLI